MTSSTLLRTLGAAVGFAAGIAVIRVNPARLPKVNADGARAFQDWLVSEEAQRIIKGFEVDRYGEPLFFPNSDDWRKRFGGAS